MWYGMAEGSESLWLIEVLIYIDWVSNPNKSI